MKIKRLMFISPKIAGGGAERVVSVLSSALADLGYHVDLVLYERKKDEYPISEKVNIFLLPKNEKNENKIVYLWKKMFLLRKIIKDNKPDVLIPFLPYQVEHTYITSRGLHIPMVVTVRNNPRVDTDSEKQRKRRDWIAKHVEGVFLQTETQREYFQKDVRKKCFVVPNPISENVLNAEYVCKNHIERLIAVGRLEEQKNFSMLLDAFGEIKKQYPELTLDIYGEGSLKEKLQQKISKLGIEDSVTLCGRTNDIVSVLREHDLFIMSSNYEGMPNSLMEAMGVGVPCISTKCPTGPSELLGECERGLLIQVGDKEGLVAAIGYFVENPNEAMEKATVAKEYIKEKFSQEKIAELLVNELEKELDKSGKRV